MRHKERIDVKNIKEKEIVKVVSIGQKMYVFVCKMLMWDR